MNITRTNLTRTFWMDNDTWFQEVTNASNVTLGNVTMPEPGNFFRNPLALSIILCMVYSIVFVIGIIGNCFVVAVVYRTPRMRTVTSYFIANMAFADILVIVFCVPITLVANLVNPWILGEFACKAASYLQGVSVSASIYTLVAITVDKFMAIYFMRREITMEACRKIILIIWIYSLTLASPWAVFFSVRPDINNDKLIVCEEVWPSDRSRVTYFFIGNLFLCYLFPLFLITLSYFLIFLKVWRRQLPGESSCRSAVMLARKSRIKVIKMMATVCFLFALSWLPLYATFSFTKTEQFRNLDDQDHHIVLAVVPVSQWLGASNSCVNPIIYAFYNHKFRAGFKAILFERDCCGPLRYDITGNRSSISPSVTYTVKMKN